MTHEHDAMEAGDLNPEELEAFMREVDAAPKPPREWMERMQPHIEMLRAALGESVGAEAVDGAVMPMVEVNASAAPGSVRAMEEVIAVFTLGGRLVSWVRERVVGMNREWVRGAEVAEAVTRGVAGGTEPELMGDTLESQIRVKGDGAHVVLEFHRKPAGKGGGASAEKTVVLMRVVRPDQVTPVRPFAVEVKDEAGKVIARRKKVELSDKAPMWPSPSAGVYVFEVSWEGGGSEVRVQVGE